MPEEDREAYVAISEKLLSFGGVKSEVMSDRDDYSYSGRIIASISVVGGLLCLHLDLDKNECKDIPCEIIKTDRRFSASVALFSDIGVGRGEALIDVLAEKYDLNTK